MKRPDGKHIFGVVKIGEKGQIVIPKEAREIFDLEPGDQLVVLGDEQQGIALVKASQLAPLASVVLSAIHGGEKE